MKNFEWHETKNQSNIVKHNISFELAIEVFQSEHLNFTDDRHDYGEVRVKTLGKTLSGALVLLVVHTDRNNTIRIISARRASKKERLIYQQHING